VRMQVGLAAGLHHLDSGRHSAILAQPNRSLTRLELGPLIFKNLRILRHISSSISTPQIMGTLRRHFMHSGYWRF
jgi:hypothetical protein